MLTPVERVLILKGADLLRDVGPRHLLRLAEVAREVELTKGDTIYREDDPADALYMVVEGRVRLMTGDRVLSEVGAGEAFGSWALVDDSARGQHAECLEDGIALALDRDEFYDVAASDLALLQEVLRALAKRLRALVTERPEEARVEGEGIEKPEAMTETAEAVAESGPAPTAGAALASAALGQARPEGADAVPPPEPPIPSGPVPTPDPIAPVGTPEPRRAAEPSTTSKLDAEEK